MKASESELQTPLIAVVASAVALGVGLIVAAEAQVDIANRAHLHSLALILFGVGAVSWLAETWKPPVGRWVASLSLGAMPFVAAYWYREPSLLLLAVIPAALANVLISPFASIAVAAVQTALAVLLVSLNSRGLGAPSLAATLASTWAVVGLMGAAYRRAVRLAEWSSDHLERSQRIALETQQTRERLEQSMVDLANANRQLLVTNERMAALRTIAEDAQKAKTMFVSKVSHEFRTPLNMILGLTGLIVDRHDTQAEIIPTHLVKDLRVVHRNCQHLASMVDDVLSLSQIETGRLTLYRERVDLTAVVDSATEVIRPLVEGKDLGLRIDSPDELPLVYCDRTRIRQVILNLLSNAARYTEDGSITVSVTLRDDFATVRVADTGPGISADDAERIFEPFSQGAGQLWRDKGGSGLGLSISRQFVLLHGGRMWLESELGTGSSFVFELPISAPMAPAGGAERWIRPDWIWWERSFMTDQAGLADEPYTPRLVILDDVGGLCEELSRYTDAVSFVGARDLDHALEEVRDDTAHAVLLNVAPGSDYGAAAGALHTGAPRTPVILATVPRTTEPAIQGGAAGYLVKPVAATDLQRTIDQVSDSVRHVLVVDDDAEVIELFTRMLHSRDSTLVVTGASRAEEGLERMRARPPDLVLLDLVMPGMGGWQLLEQKAEDESIRDIPVVLVTAQDLFEQPVRCGPVTVSTSEGISLSQLLRLSMELPQLVSEPA